VRVGISQPNFIPWRGYFDLIDDVDLFIFYHDVQYTHKDWRNRNRIKTRNGLLWLSVPVLHDSSTLICDARIDYQGRWIDKHIRSLTVAYSKAPFFRRYAPEFFALLESRFSTISELNVNVCMWVMQKLNIKTETRLSSEFKISGDKFERPLKILKLIDATTFLVGPTAKGYTDSEKFKEAGIALEFKTYEYKEYPQLYGNFEPYVSALDLLFNCGDDSRLHLKSRLANEKVG